MAKRKPGRKKPRGGPPFEMRDGFAGMDAASLERLMQEVLRSEHGSEPDSPPARARQFVLQAQQDIDPARRIKLAQRALTEWPNCADAFVVLGQEAESDAERLPLFQAAVEAARLALGDQAFEKAVGNFWLIPATRPWMRAMLELSNVLWSLGRRDESIAALREMLRLNPLDSQGARYLLLSHLLRQNQNDEATAVLTGYPEEASADWSYSRALLRFRREGDTPAARKSLRSAKRMNRFVPGYLVGTDQLPEHPPRTFIFGERSEAEVYCGEHLRHWRDTPGAIPWLRETLQVRRPRVAQLEIDKRTWSRLKAKLAGLRQDKSDIWHVGRESIPVLPEPDDLQSKESQVWALVALSPSREEVISSEISESRPKARETWKWLAETMLAPYDDDARRPGLIRVSEASLARILQPRLAEVGIACECTTPLEDVRLYVAFLSQEARTPSCQSAEIALIDDATLLALPQTMEQWQLDVRLLAVFIGDRGTPQRPWTTLIGDLTNGFVIGKEIRTEEETPQSLVPVVRQAMAAPGKGEPRRPEEIQVATVQQQEELASWLRKLHVRCVVRENLEFLDFLYADITRHLAGEGSPPGLLSVPGVQPEQVAGAFEAAAKFYRAAPWRTAPADIPLKIESSAFQSGPWFATVMGQSGMLQGLALYEDYSLLRKMLSGHMDEFESRRRHSALAVHFGEAFDIPPSDLQDLERLGWQVAGPEAYPTMLRVNPGMNIRRPLVWELKLLEACLLAVPDFVARQFRVPAEYKISTSSGLVPLTLSWCS